jgi:hypothetical protein
MEQERRGAEALRARARVVSDGLISLVRMTALATGAAAAGRRAPSPRAAPQEDLALIEEAAAGIRAVVRGRDSLAEDAEGQRSHRALELDALRRELAMVPPPLRVLRGSTLRVVVKGVGVPEAGGFAPAPCGAHNPLPPPHVCTGRGSAAARDARARRAAERGGRGARAAGHGARALRAGAPPPHSPKL